MKKLLVVICVLSFGLNTVIAQTKFFEKTNVNDLKTTVTEKLEKLKTRKEIKQWEVVKLKQSVSFSKKVKGTLKGNTHKQNTPLFNVTNIAEHNL